MKRTPLRLRKLYSAIEYLWEQMGDWEYVDHIGMAQRILHDALYAGIKTRRVAT